MRVSGGLGRGGGGVSPLASPSSNDDLSSRLQQTHIDSAAGEPPAGERTVSFAGQSLKLDGEQEARPVVEAINGHKCMEVLDLSGNTLGVPAAAAIGLSLSKHPELKKAIWFDMFTSRLRSEIPSAMRSLCQGLITASAQLVELDLSDNAFGPDGIRSVQELLHSPTCYTLQVIKFNNNGLGPSGGSMLADSLCQLHEASKASGKVMTLKVFVCGRNRLENKGAKALSKAFQRIQTLEEVSMPQNGIYHEGITAIAQALAHNTSLTTLNLNDNTLTQKGAQAVANSMSKWTKLKTLNLGDCLLKTRGVKLIAKAINPNTHMQLKDVNLSFNEVSAEGGKLLLLALASLKTQQKLTNIDLNGNMFGDSGCESLMVVASGAGVAHALRTLDDDEGSGASEEEEEGSNGEWEDVEGGDARRHTPPPAPPQQPVTASHYLAQPTAANLLALGPTSAHELLLQQLLHDGVISDSVCVADHVMRLGGIVPSSPASPQRHASGPDVTNVAKKCADHILSAACGSPGFSEMRFTNRLLEHLRLIKSEDNAVIKSAAAAAAAGSDAAGGVSGSLLLLRHIVVQPYFPKGSREILQYFLSRPCPRLDPFADLRHKLLQALYQS